MNTPTARLLRDAASPLTAVVADGRKLTLRRMNVLDRLRLFKAVGAELAANDAYLGIAWLASAVTAIDDIPIPAPANEQQIEALVLRLGDDGIEAVGQVFAALDNVKQELPPGN